MIERLSASDSQEAQELYSNYIRQTDLIVGLKVQTDQFQQHKDEITSELRGTIFDTDYDRTGLLKARLRQEDASLNHAQSATSDAEIKRDGLLWRAHQHKEEHLDEYIETARQEAEAQGVAINIEQPKE